MTSASGIKSAPDTAARRIAFVDVAKGITMVTVVWLHLGHSPERFLNLFFMPLFFFLSGMFFNTEGGFRNFLRRKSKALLLPLLTGTILGLLVEWLVYDFSDWDDIPGRYYNFTLLGNVPLWFIVSLYWSMLIVYCVERFLPHRQKCRLTIYCLLSLAGYAISLFRIHNTLFIGNALLTLPFFVIGFQWRDHWKSARWLSIPGLVLSIAILAVAIWKFVPTNIHWCIYHRFYFPSFIAAAAGIYLILSLSLLLLRVCRCRLLLWLGASTIFILVLHCLFVPTLTDVLHDGLPDGLHPIIHDACFLIAALILSCLCVVIGRRLRALKLI